MTGAELRVALMRVGVDLACGACAGLFYTGTADVPHACEARRENEAKHEAGARGWMGTYSGGKFHFHDLKPIEVSIRDIAHHLAMRCRYGGATRDHLSVAEHSVIVSQYVPPEFARHGLLHDATEAYVGDMIRPLKHWSKMKAFREIEATIEPLIAERFGLVWTPEARAAVDEVDDRILVDEVRAQLDGPEKYLDQPAFAKIRPLGCAIAALPWRRAEHVFLQRFRELFQEQPAPTWEWRGKVRKW